MTALAAELRTNIRFVLAYGEITLRNSLAYRVDMFLKLVGYPARLVMVYFLWRVLVGNGVIQGRSFQDVLTYYLLSYFLTQMYPYTRMARDIRTEIFSGDVLVFLARGVPYWAVWVGRFLATALAYLVLVTPIAAALIGLLGRITVSLQGALMFTILVFLGTMIKGLLWYLVGISAYYTEENIGTIRLYQLCEQLLSGAILPLFLFPDWFVRVQGYLPFGFTLYTPVQVLLQPPAWGAFAWLAAIGAGWCVALGSVARIVFAGGLRRFTAQGA